MKSSKLSSVVPAVFNLLNFPLVQRRPLAQLAGIQESVVLHNSTHDLRTSNTFHNLLEI